jgi:hypothetical protein
MRTTISIALTIINSCYAFSQNSDSTKNITIEETVEPYQLSDLAPNWTTYAKSSNPTHIEIDVNGDGKVDLCGFFKGVKHGLIIFGDIDDKIEILYQFDFDPTWYKNKKFGAVMFLKKKGDTVTEAISGRRIKLENDSIEIKKIDGQEFVITMIDNEFERINTK